MESKKESKTEDILPEKKKNYLSNKELRRMLAESNAQDEMTPEFIKACYLLIDRYARSPEHLNYWFLDEMKSEAMVSIVKYWRNIKYDKTANPFAYLTQTVKTGFYQFKQKETKQTTIVDMLLDEQGLHDYTSTNYKQNREFLEKGWKSNINEDNDE